jgi:hypothetical protein
MPFLNRKPVRRINVRRFESVPALSFPGGVEV